MLAAVIHLDSQAELDMAVVAAAVLCAWSLICIDWRHEADLARHRFSRQREEELEGDEEEQRQAAGSHTGYTSPDMQAVPDLPELAPSGSVTNLARKNESAIGQG